MFGSLAIAGPRVSRPANDPVTAVAVGGCAATALPLDATCAAAARRLFRQAAEGVGLPADVAHDGATMASELAANTLHAHANIQFHGSPARPAAGMPELWLYLRRMGGQQELVCKFFDSLPGWKRGAAPDPTGGTADPAAAPRMLKAPRILKTAGACGSSRACRRAAGVTTRPGPGWAAGRSRARRSGSRCRCR